MLELSITDVRPTPGDSGFLVDDGTTSVLYDTGFAFTGERLAENVRQALGGRKLDYIFLTHSHYDHALGSVYVRRRFPEAKVVAGEYALKIFGKPSARAVMRDLDRKHAASCGVSDYEDLIDGLGADIAVKDGDVIRAGAMTFRVVELAGHTRCSVGFFLEENRLLLSTETLGVFDGERTVIPSYLVGYRMTLDSISRACALGIRNILLPHFGLLDEETTAFYLNEAKKSAVETAEQIVDIFRSGGTAQDAEQFFISKFYKGSVPEIYPKDAMLLNTSITVRLLQRELCGEA